MTIDLDGQVKVTSLKHIQVKAKIPYGSKVVAFTRNYTKFLSFKANLTLKAQGQGHQCLSPSETFRCLLNSSSLKVKFEEVVQCLTVKIKNLEV